MKKKTDHKTAWRGIYAPDTTVFVGLVSKARDLKMRTEPAKYTNINEYSPKDGLAHMRHACFADWSAETGDFGREQLLR